MGRLYGKTDRSEIEKMIASFQDQLFRFAFFRTGSFNDSQDIVQDVFVRLFKNEKHPSQIQNIRHYLFASVSNACTDYFRKQRNNRTEPLEEKKYSQLAADDSSAKKEQMEEYVRINKLLSFLPYEQAEVIRLRVIDKLSFPEIATLFGLPVTTVKSRFQYGIDKLKTIVHSKTILV